MALIIKADMPKRCYDCYINNNWTLDYICPLMKKDVDLDTWLRSDCRHPSCPILGEIPNEHGALIDRHELVRIVECWSACHTALFSFSDFIKLIYDAPVVVEASK